MRKLRHPSITKILETFESEKYIFIIMEYISGRTLRKRKEKTKWKNSKNFL